jgi:hypothetical protein
MALPESALLLAGFVLAHAAWSISDAPELLVPLAAVEQNGQRKMMRFEADTQEEAIAHGKSEMAARGVDVDDWAFAREGLLNEKGQKEDVISVDIGARGSAQRITLIQRFEPYAKRHRFRLLGDPEVSIDGHIQDPATVRDLLTTVRRGVGQHPKVASLWDAWHTP